MLFFAIFVLVISAACAQDPNRAKYMVGLNGECVGDEISTNVDPDGVTTYWCDFGLRCVYNTDIFQPVSGGDVGVCQPMYRANGYDQCVTKDGQSIANSYCRNAQCCEAGLWCDNGDCKPERGGGGACEYGMSSVECQRGYLCNADQSAPLISNTNGVCTKIMSVGRNQQATHPDLCASGLLLLRGSGPDGVNICVRPEDVSCTPGFDDVMCGNPFGFMENYAMNSLDRYMSDKWQQYGQLWKFNKAYTCNERNQCEAVNNGCNAWLENLLTKNTGSPRNELGRSTFTSTRYEECNLFRCLTGKQNTVSSVGNTDLYQCSDESRPKAEEAQEASSAQLAGAVFGTAIVSTVIGCVLWKYNGGVFSIPGRG
jgi:hypothetical protein